MISEGRHDAKAIAMDLGITESNKEYVNIRFELTGDEKGGINWRGWLTDKALEYTVKSLRILGWRGNDLSSDDGIIGTEVSLVIEHEEYKGKVSAKVKYINEAGGGGKKLDKAKAKALGAVMATRIAGLAQRENGAPPDGPDVPPHTDDDIGW